MAKCNPTQYSSKNAQQTPQMANIDLVCAKPFLGQTLAWNLPAQNSEHRAIGTENNISLAKSEETNNPSVNTF
jgi:hypothetical protein